MPISPWIQQLALEFRCLKELHIHGLAINDEDLETLARTHGKDLRSLKIRMCKGFSPYGLMHVSKCPIWKFYIPRISVETGDSKLLVSLGDISNEALEGVGTHLKNMRDCRIWLGKEDGISDLPLDNGVRAMTINVLQKLTCAGFNSLLEGLTDVGME
ncbi:leucine-rich repeat, cysteine-containing subtype protein [Tanacetum coccineum]